MTYFTLNYLNSLTGQENHSFIVEEVNSPLSAAKISSINLVAQEVISKHLPCTSVPPSFPLNPSFHNNTLVILEDVLGALIESLNESDITPDTQSPIQDLSSTINLCVFGADPAFFQQDLPSISSPSLPIDLLSNSTLSIVQSPRKRASSSLTIEPNNKTPRLDAEAPILSLMDTEPSFDNPVSHQQELEISQSLSSLHSSIEFISIEILENELSFQLIHNNLMDPSTYLKYLYEGINYVLSKNIYIFDSSKDNLRPSSKSHLHYKTLTALLSLLNKQKYILSLIQDINDCTAFTIQHDLFIKKLILSLENEGANNESIQNIQANTIVQPITRKEIEPEEIASPSTTLNIPKERSLLKEKMFLMVAHLSGNVFKIYIKQDLKKIYYTKSLALLQKYLAKYEGYQSIDNIKELPEQSSHSRINLLKTLYIITKNNYFLSRHNTCVKEPTKTQFLTFLDTINSIFCQETDEILDPSQHSPTLLNLLQPYEKTASIHECEKNYSCTHYQLRLHTIHNKTTLYIEKHNYPETKWLNLLNHKYARIKTMAQDVQKLLTIPTVKVKAYGINNIQDQTSANVASLIPQLYLLTKYNKEIFQTYLEPLFSNPRLYLKIYEKLNSILQSLENSELNDNLVLSDMKVKNNPLIEINTPPATEQQLFFTAPVFNIKYFKNRYHLLYIVKKNQDLSGLKHKISQVLFRSIKYAENLLCSSFSTNITFGPDPLDPENITNITTYQDFLQILYQGFCDNLNYYQKHHSNLLYSLIHCNILQQLSQTLESIKNLYLKLNLSLPVINEVSILDKVPIAVLNKPISYSKATEVVNVRINKKSKNQKIYLLPLLKIKEQLSKRQLTNYTLYYTTQSNSGTLAHAYGHGRSAILQNLKTIKSLCAKYKEPHCHFYYQERIDRKKEPISSDQIFSRLIHGLKDSINFFSKYFPTFLTSTDTNNTLENIEETIALATEALNKDLPLITGPSILKQILKEKIGQQMNTIPSLEDLLKNDEAEN
ncbi:hypothetical protein CLAVI_000910 [Candidatus Clavichlamydia salmonicola]|uniref:hypothetical protein n=1 Tax=Candidatus Clavichlamydia salmonicola TaxID=469812 RepID=UPI001890E38E|nr:hypothetical protein [Candidatus Clavichlamydia salmonicola]MBF5051269.1 hypothetical protein [Candidatus Clavichlamydia salmonicola]